MRNTLQSFKRSHEMESFRILIEPAQNLNLAGKRDIPLARSGKKIIGEINIDPAPERNLRGSIGSTGDAKHNLVIKRSSSYGRKCNVSAAWIKYTFNQRKEVRIKAETRSRARTDIILDRASPEYEELEIILEALPDDFSESFMVELDNGFERKFLPCEAQGYNVWFFGESGAGKTGLVLALKALEGDQGEKALWNLWPHIPEKGNVTAAAPKEGEQSSAFISLVLTQRAKPFSHMQQKHLRRDW